MTELLCCTEGLNEVILLVEAAWKMMGGNKHSTEKISVTQFIN